MEFIIGLIEIFVEIFISPIFHKSNYWKDREKRKEQELREKYPRYDEIFRK